jgi:hypothetical protein
MTQLTKLNQMLQFSLQLANTVKQYKIIFVVS